MKVIGIASNVHISSAVLIDDGRVIAGAAEERFTRIKHTRDFPENSLRYCLKEGDCNIEDIDHIAIFSNPSINLSTFDKKKSSSLRDYHESLWAIPNHLSKFTQYDYHESMEQLLKTQEGDLNLHYIHHHTAHAANGYYLSGYEDAAILTIDGQGEQTTVGFFEGREGQIKLLREIKYPNSLGLIYGSITQFLGFRPDRDEWKVMALASFANGDNEYYPIIKSLIDFDERTGEFEIDTRYFAFHMRLPSRMFSQKLVNLLGAPRLSQQSLDLRHYRIAAALQKVFEEVIFAFLFYLRNNVQSSNLILSGGSFMNCVVNGKIISEKLFDSVFISSCPDDSGGSLGAALYVYHRETGEKKNIRQTHNYYGPSYDDDSIIKLLNTWNIKYRQIDSIEQYTAESLYKGKIIGRFQGRMEFGQRALGNRSILANPTMAHNKQKLNSLVKYRESFRPFAPSIIESDIHHYTDEIPKDMGRFMEASYKINSGAAEKIPAAVHVDNSARIQVVREQDNKQFYHILSHFKQLSGVGALVNTSFNLNDEPIVCTPDNSVRSFFTSALDVLVLGNIVIEK